MDLRIELLRGTIATARGRTVAIGNFDGLHLGHQRIIGACVEDAASRSTIPTVLTFDPHPAAVLSSKGAPARILSRDAQTRLLRDLGIVDVARLRFDIELSRLTPREFIDAVLVEALDAKAVVVGEAFRFGAARAGDAALLAKAGEGRFETIRIRAFSDEGGPVSSSRIREALARGDLESARTALGRPYEIEGVVERGDQRGRTIGFPTANIALDGVAALRPGVYAADGFVDEEPTSQRAAINLGVRPSIGGTRLTLEAHFPGVDRDLYDRRVRLVFRRRIRDERAFASLDELKSQIARDVADSKRD